MESTFTILKYEPNKEVVLERIISNNQWIFGAVSFIIVLIAIISVVISSVFPALFFAILLIIGWYSLKDSFVKSAVFQPNVLILTYKIGFIEWKQQKQLILGFDWFINIREKPMSLKLGYDDKILFRFCLESPEQLPTITSNIGEIMNMEVAANESLGEWEAFRFRSSNSLNAFNQAKDLTIQKNGFELQIRYTSFQYFKLDLQKRKLKYVHWLKSKAVDLDQIQTIYYEYTNIGMTSNSKVRWYYEDRYTKEKIHFFSFQRARNEHEEIQYGDLHFKSDVRYLATLLHDSLPEIEISELK